jgi:hypothetical protein
MQVWFQPSLLHQKVTLFNKQEGNSQIKTKYNSNFNDR